VLGDRQADKLDGQVLDGLYARLQQCRDLCDGRGTAGHVCRPLSSSTVRKVHYIIRGALDRAVRWQQIGVNRADLVDPPALARPSRTRPARRRLPRSSTTRGPIRSGSPPGG
jgi:integrase